MITCPTCGKESKDTIGVDPVKDEGSGMTLLMYVWTRCLSGHVLCVKLENGNIEVSDASNWEA